MNCTKCGAIILAITCPECDGEGGEEKDEGMDWEGFHVSDDDLYWAICRNCEGCGIIMWCPKCGNGEEVEIVGEWNETKVTK